MFNREEDEEPQSPYDSYGNQVSDIAKSLFDGDMEAQGRDGDFVGYALIYLGENDTQGQVISMLRSSDIPDFLLVGILEASKKMVLDSGKGE